MPDLISLSTFAPRIGDTFRVPITNGDSYPLTLVEATALPTRAHPNRQRDPFQLKFRGPGPTYLVQQTHDVQHDELGTIAMFLVPVGQDGTAFIYQAVYT
jgi:hypothetical protein